MTDIASIRFGPELDIYHLSELEAERPFVWGESTPTGRVPGASGRSSSQRDVFSITLAAIGVIDKNCQLFSLLLIVHLREKDAETQIPEKIV